MLSVWFLCWLSLEWKGGIGEGMREIGNGRGRGNERGNMRANGRG